MGTETSSDARSPQRLRLMITGGVALALVLGTGLWLANRGDGSRRAGAEVGASGSSTSTANGPAQPPVAAMPGLNADTVAKAIAERWDAELSQESDTMRRVSGARPAGGKYAAAINGPAGHPDQVSDLVCDIEQRPAITFDEPVYQDLVSCLTPVLRGPDVTAVPDWLRQQMSLPPGQPAMATFAGLAIRVQYFSASDLTVKVHSLPCDRCLG